MASTNSSGITNFQKVLELSGKVFGVLLAFHVLDHSEVNLVKPCDDFSCQSLLELCAQPLVISLWHKAEMDDAASRDCCKALVQV
jgi:hypothetical protein